MPATGSSSQQRFGEWLVDVSARRPAGWIGRRIYRTGPKAHEASFAAVLDWLGPLRGDRCLEVGCGPGVLLERVLAAGAKSAAGLDHSSDMLALAIERNREAIARERLHLKLGDAADIPWPDLAFDAVRPPWSFRPVSVMRALSSRSCSTPFGYPSHPENPAALGSYPR